MTNVSIVCSECKDLIPSVSRICLSCAREKPRHEKYFGLIEEPRTNFEKSYPINFCFRDGDQKIGLNIPEAIRLKHDLEKIIYHAKSRERR